MEKEKLKTHRSSASHGNNAFKRFSGRTEAKKRLGMRVAVVVVAVWT